MIRFGICERPNAEVRWKRGESKRSTTGKTPFKAGRKTSTTTVLVVLGTLAPLYTKLAWLFGFTSMPGEFSLVLLGILVLYIAAAEVAKKVFYQKVTF
jgi:hypothetical protein